MRYRELGKTGMKVSVPALGGYFHQDTQEAVERILKQALEAGINYIDTAHACELETSVYLYLNSRAVQMERAQKDINFPRSRFHWHDLIEGSPLKMMDWWSRISDTGVIGDPTVATEEKGERWFQAAVSRLVELVQEFRSLQIRPRVDRHKE